MEKRFEAGKYISDTPLRVIKSLNIQQVKNADGTVARVYGSWATEPDNLIIFEPGKEVVISEEDIQLKQIQNLIEAGVLKRRW